MVALLAIIVAIAIPGMGERLRRNAIHASSNELYGLLQYAREQAISRGQRITVSASASDAWAGTLEVETRDGSVLRHRDGLGNAHIQARATGQAVSTLSFYSNGGSNGSTVITLCHRASTRTLGKSIEIARSGEVSAPKDATCG
ncbi:GspH/FimT family pseudopilin [Pseudomonas sp. LRF_L74]|uniref:GspH/FimT family pseudopilin n=1 Tax=Pseudomonas sp. LRF_L74 TaxID=3369422 RepID=UPI003F5FE510